MMREYLPKSGSKKSDSVPLSSFARSQSPQAESSETKKEPIDSESLERKACQLQIQNQLKFDLKKIYPHRKAQSRNHSTARSLSGEKIPFKPLIAPSKPNQIELPFKQIRSQQNSDTSRSHKQGNLLGRGQAPFKPIVPRENQPLSATSFQKVNLLGKGQAPFKPIVPRENQPLSANEIDNSPEAKELPKKQIAPTQKTSNTSNPETTEEKTAPPADKNLNTAAIQSKSTAETDTPENNLSGAKNPENANNQIRDLPQSEIPDLSSLDPASALNALANLPAVHLFEGLSSISESLQNNVNKEKDTATKNLPEIPSPGAKDNKISSDRQNKYLKSNKTKKTNKIPKGANLPVNPPNVAVPPATTPAVDPTPPTVTGDAEGKVSSNDIGSIKGSIASLPTKDPGAREIPDLSPPNLELTGDADPKRTNQQKQESEATLNEALAEAQTEINQPLGENEIEPTVKSELLKAENVGTGGDVGTGAGNLAGNAQNVTPGGAGLIGEDANAINAVAKEMNQGGLNAAATGAAANISAKKGEYDAKLQEQRTQLDSEVNQLNQEFELGKLEQQQGAIAEAQQLRSQWSEEQQAVVTAGNLEAASLIESSLGEIQGEKEAGIVEAQQHINQGKAEAAQALAAGEQKAVNFKNAALERSSGLFGWLADKIK
ncbi:MAG: hypothetical protein ACFBSE_20985, partial [Prochloraceae cyanobacterium]